MGCNIVKWGVIFGVIHASGLKSKFKKCVHHTGGHLGRKSGGQGDLHFDNLDMRQNIVTMFTMTEISGYKMGRSK